MMAHRATSASDGPTLQSNPENADIQVSSSVHLDASAKRPSLKEPSMSPFARLARLISLAAILSGVLLAGLSLMAGGAALAGGFQTTRTPEQTTPPKQKTPPRTYAAPAARMPVEGDEDQMMAAELGNSEMRVKEAMQNVEAAQANLSRARTRRYPRGAALEEIRTHLSDSERERDTAQNDFLKLVETARQAGMPAGTMMRYMDLADRVRQDQQARAAAGR
jgi:hypothetical protein